MHSSPSCGYLGQPKGGRLWKLGCHSDPVSLGNGLIYITDSKANVTGDDRPQLRAVTASAPTLPYLTYKVFIIIINLHSFQ